MPDLEFCEQENGVTDQYIRPAAGSGNCGFCYTKRSVSSGKTDQATPADAHLQTMFGEWLSLVEHLVRDQGVGGSNPLSPTIFKIN